jgi:hypothetical protein
MYSKLGHCNCESERGFQRRNLREIKERFTIGEILHQLEAYINPIRWARSPLLLPHLLISLATRHLTPATKHLQSSYLSLFSIMKFAPHLASIFVFAFTIGIDKSIANRACNGGIDSVCCRGMHNGVQVTSCGFGPLGSNACKFHACGYPAGNNVKCGCGGETPYCCIAPMQL